MKKIEFQQTVKPLKHGDMIILTVRPLQFMPLNSNGFKPLAHCKFIRADAENIEVSYEGTISENGVISTGDKLPNKINYARILEISKINNDNV